MRFFGTARQEKFAFCFFNAACRGGASAASAWGAFGFICVPSASRGHAVERAADPLYRAGINAKALGNAAHPFTSALTFVQGRLDALPSSLARLKASADSFCDHRPLNWRAHLSWFTLWLFRQALTRPPRFRQQAGSIFSPSA